MFLTSNNKLKTKWLAWGGAITLVLVILGMVWFDKPLYLVIHNPRCDIWSMGGGFLCSVVYTIGKIFSAKLWLILTGMLLLVVFAKKTIALGIKFRNKKGQFSIVSVAKDFMAKVRTNYAFLIFSSALSAGIVAKILKILIGRFRPIFFDALEITGFRPFSFNWEFNSMPSGHTAVTFAGLVMIGMLAPKFKPLTWTLAIIVGLSRIYIGAHWPSDVIFGAFIGMVAADLVKYWAFRRK